MFRQMGLNVSTGPTPCLLSTKPPGLVCASTTQQSETRRAMTYKTLDLSLDDRGVAAVTLKRPEKRNALSGQLIDEMTTAFTALGTTAAVRAIRLDGEGTVFCAGVDLAWMRAQIDADLPKRRAEAERLANMLETISASPKPTIARIQGGAFGAGVGLAAVVDIAIAAEDARFGLTETRLGLIPATIAPYVLARIGDGAARRLFLSSRAFNAAEAASMGLIAGAPPASDLDAAVEAEIKPFLSVAPGAVARAKALIRSLGPAPDADAVRRSVDALMDAWTSDEAAVGVAAFLEKRPPPWSAT